jgi:hypothetical protein
MDQEPHRWLLHIFILKTYEINKEIDQELHRELLFIFLIESS